MERARRDGTAIDAILAAGSIQTLFQPIVHLDTRAVVGFEALTRGPAGSELESPVDLLAAATRAGRLGELDWLCRTRAMHVAARSNLHPSLSWFVNVEPAGLEMDCPLHLRPDLDRARTDVRVVLELVEREIEGHVTRMLRATDLARRDAWGVALDHVGGETGSLALLPFLQPDVVKLDMSLVRNAPDPKTAEITAAARAYAERSSAVVLAEGIETRQQEDRARTFGATYGQGYLYGPPAPLPATLPPPRIPIPLRQRPELADGRTPFETVSAGSQPRRARLSDLAHILTHLTRHCTYGYDSAVLLSLFGSEAHYATHRAVLETASGLNAFTVALIRDGLSHRDDPRHHVAPLPQHSPMDRELAMIVVTPHYSGALVVRELDDTLDTSNMDRLVDFCNVHDRNAVITAARALLEHTTIAESAELVTAGHLSARPGGCPDASTSSATKRLRRAVRTRSAVFD